MRKGPVMKIVMIEDDPMEVARYIDYFETLEDMELVAAVDGATAGMAAVEANAPDAVILDLELNEGNGVQLLPKLKALPLNPYVIVTTWTSDPVTIRGVRANGSGHVMPKSLPGYDTEGPKMVASFLRELWPFFQRGPVEQKEAADRVLDPELRLRRKIGEALGRIGIAPGTLSQRYLANSIYMAATSGSGIVDLDNEIYPVLVERFHVTKASIEKAMRTRIESAWTHTDVETLQREFTQYVNPAKGKPEVKEFIGYYANKFRERLD